MMAPTDLQQTKKIMEVILYAADLENKHKNLKSPLRINWKKAVNKTWHELR